MVSTCYLICKNQIYDKFGYWLSPVFTDTLLPLHAHAIVILRVIVVVGFVVDVFCLELLEDMVRLFIAVDDEFVGAEFKA